MIVAAVADTHGKTELIINKLRLINPDQLLFAGDHYSDGLRIAKTLDIPGSSVAGNCDGNYKKQQEKIIEIMGHRIFLVHGHQYGVKRDLNRLYYRSQELGVDAVVFGHTHIPCCEKKGALWMINPGSPVNYRLSDQGSFAIIEIDENGIKSGIISI
ncbi:MAG: metallophosphoesterase [Syntrophomonas sp.]|nr:metallophosphoesterase [Syntrophomonas sp.]